nr:olfactory receptor 2A12-like [Peromyscus maniculatus bairdii]
MWMIPVQNQSWVSEFILLGFSSDPTTNSILFIVFLLIYLSSVLGNGLIIMLICLDTQLHTPMYFFLCILALLDMCYVTTTMPQMLGHLLAHSQTISFAGCWLQMYVFGSLATTESTFFVVMAYDRYVAICHPLRYSVILNWGLCVWLAAGTWICGFFFSLFHTFFTMNLPYCGPNRVNHYFCESPAVRSLACMDTHLIEMVDLVLSVFLVVTPISLLLCPHVLLAKASSVDQPDSSRCKSTHHGSVMVATQASEQQLRSRVIVQCFQQQRRHSEQLLEHRTQDNAGAHQAVQSSEPVLRHFY